MNNGKTVNSNDVTKDTANPVIFGMNGSRFAAFATVEEEMNVKEDMHANHVAPESNPPMQSHVPKARKHNKKKSGPSGPLSASFSA